jgi:hypothetical protein
MKKFEEAKANKLANGAKAKILADQDEAKLT